MNYNLKQPWEIEDIQYEDDNKLQVLSKFTIFDESNLIQKVGNANIMKTDDFNDIINMSHIKTGIMISTLA